MYPVEIRKEPKRRLAAVAHRGPYYEISNAYETLGATLAQRGLWPKAGAMVAVYHDNPAEVPLAELSSHAGVVMGAKVALEPPLEAVTLAGGPHAVLRYQGPYSGLSAAYAHLIGTWLPASGRAQAKRPMFEIYLNSPMDTAPENLLTEICMPLKGK